MATAHIALGSNLPRPTPGRPDGRRATLEAALQALRGHPRIGVTAASSWHETAPVGGPAGQGPFLNAAAVLETDLAPEALLDVLKGIERDLGRQVRARWGPREIDLDLILYGDTVLATDRLELPHPRFRDRRFVLAPLAEVAPGARDPVTCRTVARLLADLDRARP